MNAIGLDNNKSKELSDKLNVLLADYMIFYQNTRGLHWNIKGEKFFELHLKFEELYNDLILKIDNWLNVFLHWEERLFIALKTIFRLQPSKAERILPKQKNQ